MDNFLAKCAPCRLLGTIEIPADKSISHRSLIIGALTHNKIKIENFSKGADCLSTLNIMKNLGVEVEFQDEKNILLNAQNGFCAPNCRLDCVNSGTTMLLLSGVLASQPFDS